MRVLSFVGIWLSAMFLQTCQVYGGTITPRLFSPALEGGSFIGSDAPFPPFQATPADPVGAVGISHYLVVDNENTNCFSKGTMKSVWKFSNQRFFASLFSNSDPSTNYLIGDPRIRFDIATSTGPNPNQGRWVVLTFAVPQNPSGRPQSETKYLLAVSKGPLINTGTSADWNFYSFVPFSTHPPLPSGFDDYFPDFPTLGIDQNALYIGCDVFISGPGDQQLHNSDVFVVNKSNLYSGFLSYTAFHNLYNPAPGGLKPHIPHGVDNFNKNPTYGYFISDDADVQSKLDVIRVNNPGGAPTISITSLPTPLTTADPINVPHQGSTRPAFKARLDGFDLRIGNAHIRDGFLYTVHNVGVNNNGVCPTSNVANQPAHRVSRNGCRWYQIDVSSLKVAKTGTLFASSPGTNSPGRSFWIPTIMTDANHNMVIGCSTTGPSNFIDAAFAIKGASQPDVGQAYVYTRSTSAYNISSSNEVPDPEAPNVMRWGDYSNTSLDPTTQDFWMIQSACTAPNRQTCPVVRIPAAFITQNVKQ